MGAADLVAAFNEVGSPRFICIKATLAYERQEGVECQRLAFYGTRSNGEAFSAESGQISAKADPQAAAKAVAAALIAVPEEPSPPEDIEVTDAMILVGALKLTELSGLPDLSLVASEVFRAMLSKREGIEP